MTDVLGMLEDKTPRFQSRVVTAKMMSVSHDLALMRTVDITGSPQKELIVPVTEWFPGRKWEIGSIHHVLQLDEAPRALGSVTRNVMVELLLAGVSPEVRSGAVRIMGVSRQPGVRCKVAVATTDSAVDPIAACVGRAACRVRTVGSMLGGERLDVVAWYPDPAAFLASALAPAAVDRVEIDGLNAVVFVPPHQMSAAVGGGGLNSQLAGKLTGFQVVIAPNRS